MSRPTISDAAKAMADRKTAMLGARDIDAVTGTVVYGPHLYLGFDLDLEELHRVAHIAAHAYVEHAVTSIGTPVCDVFEGSWRDGFTVGMMLAELRAKADVQEARDG